MCEKTQKKLLVYSLEPGLQNWSWQCLKLGPWLIKTRPFIYVLVSKSSYPAATENSILSCNIGVFVGTPHAHVTTLSPDTRT